MTTPKIKVIRPRIRKFCICPVCKKKQKFRKKKEHWKIVKDISLNKPVLLKAQMIYAKCLNPDCPVKSFPLAISGITRYSKATERLKEEVIASIVDDNSTCPRVAGRVSRSFNTTASRPTIDRWKHLEASKYSFKEIIKRLGFSGILFVDEYKPKRSKTYDLIAADALKNRIIYLENLEVSFGRGSILHFFQHLKELGINPQVVIVDLYITFPKAIKKVWPDVPIQYDHFHVIQWIYHFFKNAILHYRRELKSIGKEDLRSELWEHKWRILKKMDRYSSTEHEIIERLMETYKGTVVEYVLVMKEQI